ncbi:MAG: tRNA (adenosine(37)-N6)-dimethylallyltransferase MiaA [Oscillospiraceae bacterium]|nr:tRNA (adenosine(37)-N6)-dimethylallyltransferase MiaA [Oscillospiraceae bacterium]
MKKMLLVLAGPTASGKTALSLRLAEALNGEIVSADSMQIYRGMDIGTAKATPEEQAAAPHHMIDIVDPGEDYSVSRYVEDASRCCEDIFARGRQPILVGGTGLYIDSLLSGRSFAARADGSEELRTELNEEYDRIGGEAMLRELGRFDPERAALLAPTDRRRIVRAIEIYRLTGKTISAHDRETRLLPPAYASVYAVLGFADRKRLYSRIDARVDRMAAEGLFEETAALLRRGIPDTSTCMQAIGYRQAAQALRGECSQEEAVTAIKQASRRYAKRQMTWFRRREDALPISWRDDPDLSEAAETILQAMREKEG